MRCCSLWCEGFAPLLTSSRFTIPPCVPLHHQKVCHATSHVFGRVTRKAAVSLEVVQRHAWGRFTLRCCSLWCEGFAPLPVSSRVTIPSITSFDVITVSSEKWCWRGSHPRRSAVVVDGGGGDPPRRSAVVVDEGGVTPLPAFLLVVVGGVPNCRFTCHLIS